MNSKEIIVCVEYFNKVTQVQQKMILKKYERNPCFQGLNDVWGTLHFILPK